MNNKLLFATFLICSFSLFPLSKGEWDDFLWGGDEEEGEEGETTTTAPTTPKPKRYSEEGLCDHDPLTFIILKFLLDTKRAMVEGNLAPGLPPVDPFYMPVMNMDLVGTKHNYRVNANLSDIHVAGLSNFDITEINANALDLTINTTIFLPKVSVSGKYHFKGMARMVIPIPVYAKGRVTIESKGVVGSAFMKIAYDDDFAMIMEDFDFNLDMKEVDVKFKGFTGSMISQRWNAIINSMGLKMFRKMEPKMHEKIRERAILGVNQAFKEWEYDWALYQQIAADMVDCWLQE